MMCFYLCCSRYASTLFWSFISYSSISSRRQDQRSDNGNVVDSSWNSFTGRKQKGKVQFLLQLPPSTFVNLLDGIAACWYTANFMPTRITGILCESLGTNETSRNESSFLRYLPLFWPVWQSRAVIEHNLSLSQNTHISWYTYCYYISLYIDLYEGMRRLS